MIRAYYRTLVIAAGLTLCGFGTALGAFVADPAALYSQMLQAYTQGNDQGWSFSNQEYYLSTIFNAGRAYSLQRPNDPNYPSVERLTVDIASALYYDPLIDHDAVPWYVREAAVAIQRSGADPSEAAKAQALLDRVNALEDPAALARFADADGAAVAQRFPGDAQAQLLPVEADWRAWIITRDSSWRSLAIARADKLAFPLADLPATWGPGFLNAVLNASHGVDGYTADDTAHAQALEKRIAALPQLQTIASEKALPLEKMLTTLAPADEYFGPMGMSILGIRNDLNRVNKMIGYGDAKQESGEAVQIAVSIDDLHKVYPRDRDLPKLLYDVYRTLEKIPTQDAQTTRAHIRAILTIEYQDTPQARLLLTLS
jgi:hypothetical protein